MTSKPTPVPWKVVRSATCGHLRAAHNYNADPRVEWTDSDIALIEAAPELASMLRELVDSIELNCDFCRYTAEANRAAELLQKIGR